MSKYNLIFHTFKLEIHTAYVILDNTMHWYFNSEIKIILHLMFQTNMEN